MPDQLCDGALIVGGQGFLSRHVAKAFLARGYSAYAWEPDDPKAGVEFEANLRELWFVFEPDTDEQWRRGLAFISGGLVDAARRFAIDTTVVVICAIRESLASQGAREALEQTLSGARTASRLKRQRFASVRVGAAVGAPTAHEEVLACSLVPLIARLLQNVARRGAAALPGGASCLRVLSSRQLVRRLDDLIGGAGADGERQVIQGDAIIRLDELIEVSRSLLESTPTPVIIPVEGEPAALAHALAQLTGDWAEAREAADGEVVLDDVADVVAVYLRGVSGDSARASFRVIEVGGPGGVPLRAYHREAAGDAVVFVNAYGVSADVAVPLARELRSVNWYTLESRYVPILGDKFDPERTDVQQHAADVLAFLDSEGLSAVHLAGWCTGAQVVLNFAHHYPERVRSLTLINGAFALASLREVEFHRSIIGLLDRAASSIEAAGLLQQMMYSRLSLESARAGGKAPDGPGALPKQKNPHLAHMLARLFATPESLNRYARMAVRLWEEPGHAWTPSVRAPALVLTGSADMMSPPHTSLEIARMLALATLVEVQGGDHYMLYLQAERLAAEMRVFLSSDGARTAPVGAVRSVETHDT